MHELETIGRDELRANITDGPLVSIIISSFNNSINLDLMVKSVLFQTYTNWELHIVDSGSTDEKLLQLLRKYKVFYSRKNKVHVHYLQQNYGTPIIARNFGISQAQGQFITVIEENMLLAKDRLQKQVEFMQNNKHIDVLGGQSIKIGDFGSNLGPYMPMKQEELKMMMLFTSQIAPSTVLYRVNNTT